MKAKSKARDLGEVGVLGRNIRHHETSGCQSSWQNFAEAKQVNTIKYGRDEKGKNVRTLKQLQQSCQAEATLKSREVPGECE